MHEVNVEMAFKPKSGPLGWVMIDHLHELSRPGSTVPVRVGILRCRWGIVLFAVKPAATLPEVSADDV